jgi:tumor protein p53-inducible protein 3
MKAIVITEPGGTDKLALEEVPDPVAREGEILVDVRATALNRADLLQRRGLYPPPKGASEILGLECSGVVAAHGPGGAGPAIGTRVMALLPGGGYAERVSVPAELAIPIPDNLSFEEAAAIPEAFLTAGEALFTLGKLQPGCWVLVHAAAGGVGSAAVQLAHQHGAKVIATAGSPEKLEHVKALGADVVVSYRTEDFAEAVEKATAGHGADIVLDFIGGAYWDRHQRCLAEGGRNVVIGVLGGMTAEVNLAVLLRRRLQILGLVMRSRSVSDKVAITRRFVREDLPRFANGTLRPVVDSVLPLASAREAHERMEKNANVGKIVLRVSDA